MEGWEDWINPREIEIERQREFKLEMKWAESCELMIDWSHERNSVKRIMIAYLERSVEQEHGRWCSSGCHHQSPCRPRYWRQEQLSEGVPYLFPFFVFFFLLLFVSSFFFLFLYFYFIFYPRWGGGRGDGWSEEVQFWWLVLYRPTGGGQHLVLRQQPGTSFKQPPRDLKEDARVVFSSNKLHCHFLHLSNEL